MQRMHVRRWSFALVALVLASVVWAEEPKEKPAEKKPAPEEKISTTKHTLAVGGRKIAYTATAGNYVLKSEEGDPKATVFFVAYTLDGTQELGKRPITFSFNGGPGAASVWVHLGAFGPKRVEMTEEGWPLPPPGRLVDNEYTLLPESDLVFIDPVSTGYSRPAPGEDPKQFHGLEQDVEWVGEFIRLWLTRNGRWSSPKFLAGESYGTTRAAGLAGFLQQHFGMYLNGIVMISSVLNWQNQEFNAGNDIPYIIHLPSYTATAWYHKKLSPDLQADLRKTLAEAEHFALTDYALALHQGDQLAPAERRRIAEKLARYTGLSQDFVERSDLRILVYRFFKELLRADGKTVGRLDGRFTGFDRDSAGEFPEFDPASEAASVGYIALLNDYLRRELGVESDLPFLALSRQVWPWDFGEENRNRYVNVAETLREAMTRNPRLKVLLQSGYYDFATPYFDSVYTMRHLGLPEELRGNIEIEFYEAGHMMYIRRADHKKFYDDVVRFIRKAM